MVNNVEVRLVSWEKAEAGDEVTVSWGGNEYNGKVVDVKEGAVKIHYLGWNAGYDDWVSTEEEKPSISVRKDIFK